MVIKTPVIAINYKTYTSATGTSAVTLSKICQAVARKKRASILVAVQPTDIAAISRSVKIPVFAQHVDAIEPGAHTGHVLPEAVIAAGASGTILNHSEHQVSPKVLAQTLARCKALGLSTIVCASTIGMAKSVAKLKPDFVAYEPPELIGGTVSVTTRPQAISRMVRAVRSVNKRVGILVGAGVKTEEDVKIALKLKTQGVLLASGVAANKEPKKALLGLVAGLRK